MEKKVLVGAVSLGCCKNRVDTEALLANVQAAGHGIQPDETLAQVVFLNTCGFLASARQEALEVLDELHACRPTVEKIIVTGCMAQRMPETLLAHPAVDGILGVGQYHRAAETIQRVYAGERVCQIGYAQPVCGPLPPRMRTTPHFAYLRVADGCDNRCSYCAIPGIRGPYHSVPFEHIIEEAKGFLAQDVRELVVVAQDTTRYGEDLYGHPRLAELLVTLADLNPTVWVRFLYAYPEKITPALLDAIESRPNICRYLDVPIQHSHDDILRAMNRRSTTADLERMVALVRARLVAYTLRTTVICGFPGESDVHHRHLLRFLKENPFDCLGAFAYSREPGTPAHDMPDQVPEKKKQQRLDKIMLRQQAVSKRWMDSFVGQTLEVLCESREDVEGGELYQGRTMGHAPDIDGLVFFSGGHAQPGEVVSVKITHADTYDLIGRIVK